MSKRYPDLLHCGISILMPFSFKYAKMEEKTLSKEASPVMTGRCPFSEGPVAKEQLMAGKELNPAAECPEFLGAQTSCRPVHLEVSGEKVEDLARCYHLLDKVYEWCLKTMHFVGEMKVVRHGTTLALRSLVNSLDEYLNEHPPMAVNVLDEMLDLASGQGHGPLLHSCKKAESRYEEAVRLVRARRTAVLQTIEQLQSELHCVRDRGRLHGERESSPEVTFPFSRDAWRPAITSTPRPLSAEDSVIGAPLSSESQLSCSRDASRHALPLDRYLQDLEDLQSPRHVNDHLTLRGRLYCLQTSQKANSNLLQKNLPVETSGPSETTGSSSSSGQDACPTWRLCEQALEAATARVRMQNLELLPPVFQLPCQGCCTDRSAEDDREEEQFRRQSSLFERIPFWDSGPTEVDVSTAVTPSCCFASPVDNSKKKLMLVMRELLQTERSYVKSLEFVIDEYVPELLGEDIPQVLRGKASIVFGNIQKIFQFHSKHFLKELEKFWYSPFLVGQCFLQYETKFCLYAIYNKNKPKSDAIMAEYGTTFFRRKQVLLGDKMDLSSYLLKPVQRLAKYALLLKQIIKECPAETDGENDLDDLKAAEDMVRFQLRHGNDLLAMDALRDCHVKVEEQGRLLKQDDLIVWQGRHRKSMRRVFLFEGLVLFSKARPDPRNRAQDLYYYKNSIKTTDVGLTEQVGDSATKFELWFRKRKLNGSFILQAPSPEDKAAWIREISGILWNQALKSKESRLTEMSSQGLGRRTCLDIKPNGDRISTRPIILSLQKDWRCRSSMAVSPADRLRSTKRPHSISSVSSSSSSGSSGCNDKLLNFPSVLDADKSGYNPASDRQLLLDKSFTRRPNFSQESGFSTDDSSLNGETLLDEIRRQGELDQLDSFLSSSAGLSQTHCHAAHQASF